MIWVLYYFTKKVTEGAPSSKERILRRIPSNPSAKHFLLRTAGARPFSKGALRGPSSKDQILRSEEGPQPSEPLLRRSKSFGVFRSGFEPLTQGFSVLCSNQLSYQNVFCFLYFILDIFDTFLFFCHT